MESVLNSLDKNDNLQLSKKVGGMDRQVAKLNKSIEKIDIYSGANLVCDNFECRG